MEKYNNEHIGASPGQQHAVKPRRVGLFGKIKRRNVNNLDIHPANYSHYDTQTAPYDPHATAPFNVAAFLNLLASDNGAGSTPDNASTDNGNDASTNDGYNATTDNNYEAPNDDYNSSSNYNYDPTDNYDYGSPDNNDYWS